MIVVRTSFRGAPRRIIFNASNTAPLGRVCARDGDVGSACRLDDPLAFAINQRPVSRNASSIAQTDVQHFADEEVMRNSRASLAEVARSTGFTDQHHLDRVFRRTTGITSS